MLSLKSMDPKALCAVQSQARMIAVTAQKTSYVGHKVALASEYHESDFDWHEHARQVASQSSFMQAEGHVPVSTTAQGRKFETTANVDNIDVTAIAYTTSIADEGKNWENFYQQHTEAKFYKLRRYILKVGCSHDANPWIMLSPSRQISSQASYFPLTFHA